MVTESKLKGSLLTQVTKGDSGLRGSLVGLEPRLKGSLIEGSAASAEDEPTEKEVIYVNRDSGRFRLASTVEKKGGEMMLRLIGLDGSYEGALVNIMQNRLDTPDTPWSVETVPETPPKS